MQALRAEVQDAAAQWQAIREDAAKVESLQVDSKGLRIGPVEGADGEGQQRGLMEGVGRGEPTEGADGASRPEGPKGGAASEGRQVQPVAVDDSGGQQEQRGAVGVSKPAAWVDGAWLWTSGYAQER